MMVPRVCAPAHHQVCVLMCSQGQDSHWQVHPNRMKGSEADSWESGTTKNRQAEVGVARQAAEE